MVMVCHYLKQMSMDKEVEELRRRNLREADDIFNEKKRPDDSSSSSSSSGSSSGSSSDSDSDSDSEMADKVRIERARIKCQHMQVQKTEELSKNTNI